MIRRAQACAASLGVAAMLLAAPALAIDDPGAIPTPEPPPPPPRQRPSDPGGRDEPPGSVGREDPRRGGREPAGGREDPRAPRDSSGPDRFALEPSRGSLGAFLGEPAADLGVTLSVSPLHFFLPMLLVQGEIGLDRKWSVDGVFGFTRAKILDPSGAGNIIRRPLYVGAVHGRYYILGNYRSGFPIVIGPKLIRVDTDQLLDLALFNGTNSVGIDVMIGFKKVIRGLFTAEFLGGFDYLVYRPTPAHPSGPDVGDRPRAVLLAFAFNVGLSF